MECSTFQQPNSHSRRGATPAKCMLRKAQVLARTSLAPCLEPCRTIGRFPAEPSSFTCNNMVLLVHIVLKPRNVDRWVGSWSCGKLGFGILRALLVYLQAGNHVKNFETLTWLNFRIALPTTSRLNRVRQLFISVCFAIIGDRTWQWMLPPRCHLGPRTSDLGPRTWPRTSNLGPRTSDLGPRISDLGPRTSDLGPRTSNLGPRTSDLGPRTSDLGPRTSDLGPRTSDLGPRVSDLGPRTSGRARCQVRSELLAVSL